MTCVHRPSVEALIDDELPRSARAEVEQHLTSCVTCAAARADGVALRRVLQAGLRRTVPKRQLDALTGRIVAGPDEPAASPSSGRAAAVTAKRNGASAKSSGRAAQAASAPAALAPRSPHKPTTPVSAAPPPTSASPPAVPGYAIQSKLGVGGMGTVFRATQQSMGRDVAVKLLAPRFTRDGTYVKRFLREARAAASLNHPNIVRTIDAGSCPAGYYHAMELVEGESLRERLRRGPLTTRNALAIVFGIASALEHAEQHGIVHRDIKPDNIMIEASTGRPKLADLGLARFEAKTHDTGSLTVAGTVMGTPNYMSPEQVRDTSTADHRSDMFSLGATLYHSVVGRAPFRAASAMEVLTRVLEESLALPADLEFSSDLRRVFALMVNPRPSRRYQTASDLLLDLRALLADEPPPIALGILKPATESMVTAQGGSSAAAVPTSVRRRRAALPARRQSSGLAVAVIVVSVVAIVGMLALKR
ncbi:MAG: protein kinase domain-containing protein, partial [Planctomycetota bacterium]